MHLDVRFIAARYARAFNTTLLLLGLTLSTQALAQVSALGRLEPWHGALKITAPITPESTGGIVLGKLLVERGDDVKAGALLAVTEAAPLMQAQVNQAKAEREYRSRLAAASGSAATAACIQSRVSDQASQRRQDLLVRKLVSNEVAEQAKGESDAFKAGCASSRASAQAANAAVSLADAELRRAQAVLQRAFIRAPVDGRVLDIHARPGEMIGPQGILELGRVDRMYAIAEVYETDIGKVRVGQTATISSRAIGRALTGTVERIRQQVRKLDQLGTDPAARKDARIVEVEIRLDNAAPAAGLTNLQVEIIIGRRAGQ
jgi:HlyD family secretion protein